MIVDGPHFQATDEGELVFLLSDGDNSRRPTEHDILEPDEESPLRDNYYLRIPLEHPDSGRWRDEIAKYLAPLVLGATMGRLPWTLAAFPAGYELFLHKSPRPQGRGGSTLRRDFLLYGSTDVPFFSSPLEFVRHAEWLMRGAHRTPDRSRAPRCECKYCDVDGRNQKQSVISRELRVRRARVLAQLGDSEADADSDA
ncbi:hypothetical protein EDB83DRAFT_2419232 [Lactarius deliciosus]|nr:hypothetical protein EDB83DRAFT_2419232 [Lactarius deliciosus]